MKFIIAFLCSVSSFLASSQANSFPVGWTGNWKGELQWYKTGNAEPQKVEMELRIQSTDIPGTFTWHIIYGTPSKDSRPYTLVAKDSTQTHWVIDELNGILLDQYWVGNKFCGAFTVMNNTIINNYWMENDRLMVEFFSIAAKPFVTTGKGTEESPNVDSYRVGSYQRAELIRQK